MPIYWTYVRLKLSHGQGMDFRGMMPMNQHGESTWKIKIKFQNN